MRTINDAERVLLWSPGMAPESMSWADFRGRYCDDAEFVPAVARSLLVDDFAVIGDGPGEKSVVMFVPMVAAPEPTASATVLRVMDISTGHLPPSVREAVDDGEGPRPCFTHTEAMGWMFYVPADPDEDENEKDWHQSWRDIFAHARKLGCDYVLIDQDASPAALPWYGDSETVEVAS